MQSNYARWSIVMQINIRNYTLYAGASDIRLKKATKYQNIKKFWIFILKVYIKCFSNSDIRQYGKKFRFMYSICGPISPTRIHQSPIKIQLD